MVKKHLKSLAAPRSWVIQRKQYTFTVRPLPGKHKLGAGMPLRLIFRNLLGHVKSRKEMNYVLTHKNILVDGKKVDDGRTQVGLMDVLSITDLQEYYRMLINTKGKITAVKIGAEEGQMKPLKLVNKSLVKGKVQLQFHDGTTTLVDKNTYKTGDTLLVSLPDRKVIGHLALEPQQTVYLTQGKHTGESGLVKSITTKELTIESQGTTFTTPKASAFVVGKGKSQILLPSL